MGAAYNSQERNPPPLCLPGTREEVLKKIHAWVEAVSGKRVLWLHGPAGAGKSAIAQTVAEACAGRKQLAASFFFARTAAHRNAAKYLFPTIAVQIALSAPEKRRRLDEILRSDPYISERGLGSVDLLVSLLEDRSTRVTQVPSPFVVIIDGLDECQRDDDQRWIFAQITRLVHTHDLPLRFLIVSRPEFHLREAFEELNQANIANILSLYGDYQASNDISSYLQSEFSKICGAERHRNVMRFVPRPWPSGDIIQRLVRKSEGYFIYVSTVIKFIDEEQFSPTARLEQVLGTSNSSILFSQSDPFAELDKLYIQILSSYPISQLPMLKYVLGYLVVFHVQQDVYIHDMDAILGLPPGQVQLTLRGLRSVVLPGRPRPVLVHASFGDFLRDKTRAKAYYIDSEEWIYTAFSLAFPPGCRLLCQPLEHDNRTSKLLEGRVIISSSIIRVVTNVQNLEGSDRDEYIWDLSQFLRVSFGFSSRKDLLVEVFHETLEECLGLWSSCLRELDNWTDKKRFHLLDLLVAIICPENEVSVTFS